MSPLSLRVLYLIDSLAPGGAERSLVEMAPGLLESGIDLRVAVLHDRGGLTSELQSCGVEVRVVGGSTRSAWLQNAVRLVGIVRPDLVHTTLFESDLAGRLGAYVRRVPVVSTLASTPYGPEHSSEHGIRRTRMRAAQALDALTGKLVTRFHAVSRSAADAGISRLHIDPAKIEVIPRGRDLRRLGERSAERRTTVRQRLGVDEDAPMLLVLSRQEPQKGIDVLLRAMPRILREEPRARLIVAGREGRATAGYATWLSDGAVERATSFLGERDDVADLLAAADILVLPSLREGLPGAVLEAMAVGIPIVGSDLPPVREAVPGPEYALLVPPGRPELLGDAVIEVLRNPAQAIERASNARFRFEECFDIAQVVAAMARFYRTALRTS